MSLAPSAGLQPCPWVAPLPARPAGHKGALAAESRDVASFLEPGLACSTCVPAEAQPCPGGSPARAHHAPRAAEQAAPAPQGPAAAAPQGSASGAFSDGEEVLHLACAPEPGAGASLLLPHQPPPPGHSRAVLQAPSPAAPWWLGSGIPVFCGSDGNPPPVTLTPPAPAQLVALGHLPAPWP